MTYARTSKVAQYQAEAAEAYLYEHLRFLYMLKSMPIDRCSLLRLPRSDQPHSFVLVHVADRGKTSLNLKLVATEGEAPYNAIVKHSDLGELRYKNYHGSEDDFAQIICTGLKLQTSGSRLDRRIANVEVTATICESKDGGSKELHISLKQRIDNITQRIGNITLKQDDDETIELFDWAGDAVDVARQLEEQVVLLNEKLHAKEALLKKLDLQLEELLESKEQHENQLITNFVQLLNEKKLKIRNQQRLLSSAEVDPNKVAALTTKRSTSSKNRTASKRKTLDAHNDVSEPYSTLSDMEIDTDQHAEGGDNDEAPISDERETPQPLEEEETASESSGKEALSPAPNRRGVEAGGQESSKPPELAAPSTPPPRRELPFVSKTRTRNVTEAGLERAEPRSQPWAGDGSDDDDEL